MNIPVDLFDLNALALRRARAARSGGAWFLHDEAQDLIKERIEEVNRTFTNAAIIGWRGPEWARALGLDAAQVAEGTALDIAPAAHDLIIHAMALHWAADPVGQLIQMRRGLRPDGLMLSCFLGGESLHELRSSFAEAEARVMGGISPRVAPMGEIRDLGGLLQRAGFALPVADNFKFTVSYENPIKLMHDLRAMGETNVMSGRVRTPLRRALLREVMDIYAQNFSLPDGRIRATFDLIFLTGWAPSEDQQKPLRPGSAQARLADALGVKEIDPNKG